MGRITLVHRVAGSAENQRQFVNIIRKGFDYFSEAYVTATDFDVAQKFLDGSRSSPHLSHHIKNIVDQANRSYSAVESDSASLLILNEWFTPAWKVRVNGKKQPVLRVNEWQTGVLVPAGKNLVEFEYRPILFRALMALHRITFVLLLFFVIFAVIRKARDRSSKRQSS
jgi:hypothetical protein